MTAALVTHGLTPGAWGFPQVAGRCPSCGAAALFLAVGGYVTCAVIGCADPCAASDLLDTYDPGRLGHRGKAADVNGLTAPGSGDGA